MSVNFIQAFGIGYLKQHPDGQVRVHSEDPKPILRVKPNASSNFRRYTFVTAVLGLDPAGKLGLDASDYKVGVILYSLRFETLPMILYFQDGFGCISLSYECYSFMGLCIEPLGFL